MNMLRKTTVLLATTALIALASGAVAQDAAPASPAADEGSEVVVTGSRLPSTSLTSAAPVTVLNRAMIDATGTSTIGALLRQIPASSPAVTEMAGRGNDGSSNVALRGLSAVNTLVLINGRRQLSNSPGGTVDLSSIPFEAVDRVEVLQDGASAIYGSDAIAGVINLITRPYYDGVEVKASYGESVHGDLPERIVSGVFGKKYDTGSFVFTGSWRKNGGNVIADRRISRDPDWRDKGGRNYRDSAPLNTAFGPTATNPGGIPGSGGQTLIIKDGVTQATSISDFRDYIYPGTTTPITSGNDGINYWNYESSASANQEVNLFFNGEQELGSNITAFVEASYNNRKSLGYLAPDYFDGTITVAADNAYNPFGVPLTAYRTLTELRSSGITRANDVNSNLYRVIGGLRGELFGWKWDASANLQHLSQYTYGGRGIVTARLQAAAGPAAGCAAIPGCVPINLFAGNGGVTDAMLQYITADHFRDVTANLHSFSANTSGKLFSLPAGDVNLAVGAEYRTEDFRQIQDNASDYTTPTPPFLPPQRKVAEAYAEVGIPILRDLPFIYSLDVDAAARYSHYNAFGGTTNPKFDVKWRPTHDLLVRGSWGTAFRAPTFTEANTTQARGYRPVTDPCQGGSFASFSGCHNVRAPSTTGTFVVTGGNPDLKPETAHNLTAGMVYTPSFAHTLSITVDFYKIKKKDIIGTADTDYIIAQNAAGTDFLDAVERDTNGAILNVYATRDNLLSQTIQGVDASINYTTPEWAIGKFNISLATTYLDSYKLSPSASQAPTERVGTYSTAIGTLARWRGNGQLTWMTGNLTSSLNVRYVGPVVNTASFMTDGAYPKSTDYIQADIAVNYTVPSIKTKFTLGVDNLWDEMPPYLEGNYYNGFDNTTFDSRGAFFYFRVTKKF